MRDNEKNDRRTEPFRKLFIGGLTLDTREQDLKDYFGKFGELVDCVVMINKATGRSRGFGFVTYSEPEMVDVAQANRPHTINGRTIESKRATPREDSSGPEAHQSINKLFVAGIKKETTEEELEEYFSKYGKIEKVEIMKLNSTGEPRGFGFVTFEDYDAVDKSVLYRPHSIGASKCDCRKAISKDKMPKGDHRPRSDVPPPRGRDHYGYAADPYYSRTAYPTPAGDPYGYDSYGYGGYDAYGGGGGGPGYSERDTGRGGGGGGAGVGGVGGGGYYNDPYGNGWSGSDNYEAGRYDDQGYSGGPSRGSSRGYAADPYARPPAPSYRGAGGGGGGGGAGGGGGGYPTR